MDIAYPFQVYQTQISTRTLQNFHFIYRKSILNFIYFNPYLTMVRTNAQNRTFFEGAAYMSIECRTVTKMDSKGLHNYDNVAEFDQDAIKAVDAQLRRPGGTIEDPNYVVPPFKAGQPPAPVPCIPTPPYQSSAKSQRRLLVASHLLQYYATTGRPVLVSMMQYTTIGKDFETQWNALIARKGRDVPSTPFITKNFGIIKWLEVFKDHLTWVIEEQKIPFIVPSARWNLLPPRTLTRRTYTAT